MSARFSESEAALIDAARGAEERGVWLRRVALAAAERVRRDRTTAPRKPKAAPAAKRGPEDASQIVAGIFRRTNGEQ